MKREEQESVCEDFAEEITNGTGGFKVYEEREFPVYPDRDLAIVEWTIRCLANPLNPLSAKVMDEINEHRKNVLAGKEGKIN
jgi:hypothetical protein